MANDLESLGFVEDAKPKLEGLGFVADGPQQSATAPAVPPVPASPIKKLSDAFPDVQQLSAWTMSNARAFAEQATTPGLGFTHPGGGENIVQPWSTLSQKGPTQAGPSSVRDMLNSAIDKGGKLARNALQGTPMYHGGPSYGPQDIPQPAPMPGTPNQRFIDAATKPIVPLSKLAPDNPTTVLGGVGKGAAEVAEGLTSPANVVMAGASGGLGLLGQVSKMLPRAIVAGFSAQMFKQAYDEIPEVRHSWIVGDAPGVARALTRAVASGALGAASAFHAVRGGGVAAESQDVNEQSTGQTPAASGDIFDRAAAQGVNDVHEPEPAQQGRETERPSGQESKTDVEAAGRQAEVRPTSGTAGRAEPSLTGGVAESAAGAEAQPAVRPVAPPSQGLERASDSQLMRAKDTATEEFNTEASHDIDDELAARHPDVNLRRVVWKGDGYYVRPDAPGKIEGGPYPTESAATAALLSERSGTPTGKVIDAQPVDAQAAPRPIVRYDEPGVAPDASKPHGAYFSFDGPGFESPHAEDFEKPTASRAQATATNPLVVPPERVQSDRFRGITHDSAGPASAGVSALKQLTTPPELSRILKLSKPDLVSELGEKFPGPDYTKYSDRTELREAYGAQLARSQGYDAIEQHDPQSPNFSEYVALHPDAYKMAAEPAPPGAKEVEANTPAANTPAGNTPETSPRPQATEAAGAEAPADRLPVDEPTRTGEPSVTYGSGLGALEPFLRESVSEVKALKAKRDAALAELEKTKTTPAQQDFGQKTLQYFTGERDVWGARVNQAVDKLKRLVPDSKDQEALALMRDFKSRPGELKSFLDGTHPSLDNSELGREQAVKNVERLRPAIERALKPTLGMQTADKVLGQISDSTLREGQRLGFLNSSISSEDYVPHILHPKGDDGMGSPIMGGGRAMGGKIGKRFGFAQQRSYPTLLDAVADGIKPKTLNALDAFAIHGDKFATARATRLLTQALRDTNVGKYGTRDSAPDGWVPLAAHSNEFKTTVPFVNGEGEADIAQKQLFVPPFIEKALQGVTDPNYVSRLPGFKATRAFQAYTKAMQLGMSFYHAATENYMALANMGPSGWAKALAADRDSPQFLSSERDMIAHGGTSPIQGKTYEAYRSLQPGSIPSWGEIWRHAPVAREMDQVAGKISDFTFGNLQRRFKVTDYMLHSAGWMADHPDATPGQLAAAKQSIAKQINSVYGGLHWENMGMSRATTEVARAIMLAPDWTLSNVANVKYAFEGKSAATGTWSPAGKMARMFWLRTAVGGLAATQLASVMLSGKFSPHSTEVYMGKDNKGQDIYQNMFFKGAPGDMVNMVHNVTQYGAVMGLARTMTGKAAPLLRTGLQLATNRDYLGREIVPKGMNPIAGTARGAMSAVKSLAPTPLSAANLMEMLQGGAGKRHGDYTIPEFISTAVAGTPPRHIVEKPPAPTQGAPIWNQIVTGRTDGKMKR